MATYVQLWKRNVKNETAWKGDSRAVEECSCGGEGFRLPAFVADQELHRLANRNIVVNNEHD